MSAAARCPGGRCPADSGRGLPGCHGPWVPRDGQPPPGAQPERRCLCWGGSHTDGKDVRLLGNRGSRVPLAGSARAGVPPLPVIWAGLRQTGAPAGMVELDTKVELWEGSPLGVMCLVVLAPRSRRLLELERGPRGQHHPGDPGTPPGCLHPSPPSGRQAAGADCAALLSLLPR